MRISRVRVRGYRSLADIDLQLDDYGVLIGANGSGKSSLLYALDWFFNNSPLGESDVLGYQEGVPLPEDAKIEVAVTFTDLTAKDRERLQQYGRGDVAEVRRTWHPGSNTTKTVGNAKQGPGFAEIRALTRVGEFRPKYAELRGILPDLADLGNSPVKDDVGAALNDWERRPENSGRLVEITDDDANQMLGWNGSNVIKECVRFILVPAASSITDQVGETDKKSALSELIGVFMSAASARAQADWLSRHAADLEELTRDIRMSVEAATGIQTGRVNSRLASLVPNARVTLTPFVPAWTPKANPSITTAVTIDGVSNDVSRQGHGVQRAVMISMFQAMVPDEDLTRTTHVASDGESQEEAEARLAEAIASLPSVIVSIEEPEIYQHPIRARAFARTLANLSEQSNVQVLLATHSPYFLRPEQFNALRRFALSVGRSVIAQATVPGVAVASGIAPPNVEKAILANLQTEFSEGFFADVVVLTEGPTDRSVLGAVAARLGHDLDSLGITIQPVGKGGLRVAAAILTALGVPVYVLVDGDFLGAQRKHPTDSAKEAQAHASHKSQTDLLVGALPTSTSISGGSTPYSFGDPSLVTAHYAIWHDDIEEELLSWSSFSAELQAVGVDLATRSNKNPLAYRNAVGTANISELPPMIRSVIDAIIAAKTRP